MASDSCDHRSQYSRRSERRSRYTNIIERYLHCENKSKRWRLFAKGNSRSRWTSHKYGSKHRSAASSREKQEMEMAHDHISDYGGDYRRMSSCASDSKSQRSKSRASTKWSDREMSGSDRRHKRSRTRRSSPRGTTISSDRDRSRADERRNVRLRKGEKPRETRRRSRSPSEPEMRAPTPEVMQQSNESGELSDGEVEEEQQRRRVSSVVVDNSKTVVCRMTTPRQLLYKQYFQQTVKQFAAQAPGKGSTTSDGARDPMERMEADHHDYRRSTQIEKAMIDSQPEEAVSESGHVCEVMPAMKENWKKKPKMPNHGYWQARGDCKDRQHSVDHFDKLHDSSSRGSSRWRIARDAASLLGRRDKLARVAGKRQKTLAEISDLEVQAAHLRKELDRLERAHAREYKQCALSRKRLKRYKLKEHKIDLEACAYERQTNCVVLPL